MRKDDNDDNDNDEDGGGYHDIAKEFVLSQRSE